MSSDQSLTRQVDYRRCAVDNRRLVGSLGLSALPRTADVTVHDLGEPVVVSLEFDEDMQRRVLLRGHLKTTLALPCQRCLEAAEQAIDTSIGGIVVTSDSAAADVPREWEPIMADGDTLDLYALVDDELLLALPMTVQCDRPDCRAAYDKQPAVPESDKPASDKPNPFAALASLKRDDDSSR